MLEIISEFIQSSGLVAMTWKQLFMILLSLLFLYLAIYKKYEPYLLVPISFGMLLTNMPLGNIMGESGLLGILYMGVEYGIYPPLIFLGVGVATDFGPLIANPKSLLLGAAAQIGIFFAFLGALLLGFTAYESAAIGIIGGADGPTAIYLTSILASDLLGPVALAAYSYMALVPIIQPPIIKMLTTKEERLIRMKQLRPVSRMEKILFPVFVSIIVIILVPASVSLVGMLMFGNLLKESRVVPKLSETAGNSLSYIVTILLGLTVGAKADAETFMDPRTLGIIALGLVAFAVGTASGVLFGKIMCKVTKGEINPIIGAAGVSAVPMSARVVQNVGHDEDPGNFLLMHAMGPNVAGVIGSAVTAGILLNFFL